MKEILLTQGKVALVDDDDYNEISKYKWYAHKNRNTFYAHRTEKIPKRTIHQMHRIILNPRNGLQIDHIDGNGLNNQKSNLRLVTRRQNLQNSHIKKSSAFPGVLWYKQTKKWQAKIKISGRTRHLGYFKDELEAATAYRVACAVLVQEREPE